MGLPLTSGLGDVMRTKIMAAFGLALLMFGGGAVLLASGGRPQQRAAGAPGIVPTLAATEAVARADIDALIAAAQARVRAGDGSPGDFASLGIAYLQKAKATAEPTYYTLADRALSAALRLEPKNLPSLLGLGELALGRHDFAGARRWGHRALAVDAHNASAHGILGDAAVELGRYRRAFRLYQEMIDLRPGLSSYARVSYARELSGDKAGAIAAMKSAVVAGGDPADRAWARNQLGDLYFNSGRLRAAAREYRAALELAPDFVPPDAGLGRVAAARGSFSAAIRSYQAIVERYPLPQYVTTLGDLYTVAGRTSEANRQYDLVAAQQGLFESSGVIPDIETALFLADQAKYSTAAVRLARAQYAERPSVRAADALAWALYKSGRFTAARRFSAEALRLGTRDASYHYHAGMIAAASKHTDPARRHLARALEINPYFSILDSVRARRALANLGGRP